ncbi:MAG: acyltransferase family protein [Hyphomicrobiales bacterium]|nr:acyltransferase family protein [Hyphomicrobiales bacterium]
MRLDTKLTYRREVDGLRAVAVLPVVFFHAGFPHFDGGFLGVDIFFVISGYLISGLIIGDKLNNRFSIVEFYERRIRRIFPALFAVLLFCAAGILLSLHPDRIRDFGQSLLSVVFFVSNVYFWRKSGYFGSDSEQTPLLHTWSLSVEEQFYLVYPILLVLLWRFGRRNVAWTFLAVSAISILIAEWGWRNQANANFFLTPSRSWELLVGALVALAPRPWVDRTFPPAFRQFAALAGLAAILAAFLLFDKSTPHPSLLTLVPVLGTAVVLAFADSASLAGRILSNRAFVGIGLISYSLYLWHQPILVFARIHGPSEPGTKATLVLIAASFVAAYFSWRWIERPFRTKGRFSRRAVFYFGGGVSATALAAGFVLISFSDTPLGLLDPESYARYRIVWQATDQQRNAVVSKGCHIWDETVSAAFKARFDQCARLHGKALVVTGGSHGMDMFSSLSIASTYPFIAGVSRGYCRAHAMLGRNPPYPCHYADLAAFIQERRQAVGKLLYTQTPDRLFTADYYKATLADLSRKSMDEVIDYLLRIRNGTGVDVAIIGFLPPIRMDTRRLDIFRPLDGQLRNLFDKRAYDLTLATDEEFRRRAMARGIPYYSKIDAFELKLPDDLMVDGQITYFDKRHLSIAGETYFGAKFVRNLEPELITFGPGRHGSPF